MQNTKIKLLAAALVAGVGLVGWTQIASAQTAPAKPAVSVTYAQAQSTLADAPEAGDTPDVPGAADATEATDPAEVGDVPDTADTPEAGDVPDAADPTDAADLADAADTDQVQDNGPEVPDTAGSASK